MNDGMYTNLRNYLEEIANLSKQLLAEQQRTNELLTAQVGKNGETEIVEVTPKAASKKKTTRK